MAARRRNRPICKKFVGRSRVASEKLRINGKFVKKSEFVGETIVTCGGKVQGEDSEGSDSTADKEYNVVIAIV
jgi:hypothetical protein